MGIASLIRHAHVRLSAGILSVLSIIALTASSACVEDQDFLIVEKAIWFADRETCTLSGSEATPLNMPVDVSFDTRIGMGFWVTNNQSPNPGSNSGINDSEITIETAEVELSFSGGAIEGGSFELTLPSNSVNGGDSTPVLVQVPTEVTDSIRANMTPGEFETLEMAVTFKGRKYGRSGNNKLGEVETRTYVFPFEICMGCLASCGTSEGCMACPTQTEWYGTCGFAQGLPVLHPICATE